MTTLVFIELMAVIVSALFGVLLAARHSMDLMGAFVVAFAVAFGGGTLRDLFLDRTPLFWIANPHYPVVVLAIAVVAGVIVPQMNRIRPWLLLPDALGMGLFTVVGTGYAMEAGVSPFVAMILGVITGTFGGVLGDVLCNEVPELFKPTAPLSATCAFAGAGVYWAMRHFEMGEDIAVIVGLAVVVCFRLAAVKWNWRLPPVRGGG